MQLSNILSVSLIPRLRFYLTSKLYLKMTYELNSTITLRKLFSVSDNSIITFCSFVNICKWAMRSFERVLHKLRKLFQWNFYLFLRILLENHTINISIVTKSFYIFRVILMSLRLELMPWTSMGLVWALLDLSAEHKDFTR